MTKIIILGSSAEFPLPRTITNKFEDYLNITDYQQKFELHDDKLCNLAKKGGKDRRTRACLAITADNKLVIIDAGPDIKYQLKKYKLKWPDAVFITHEHPDADYGLKYLPQSTQIFGEKLGGVKHEKLINLWGLEVLPFKVAHSKIAPYTGYKVKFQTANHKAQKGLSPRVLSGKFSICYATDMASVLGIQKYVQDCDILFADGSILKRNLGGHLSMVNQLKYYKKWGLKKIIFTHIGHATLPHEELVRYLRDIYPRVDVAYDGLIIEL